MSAVLQQWILLLAGLGLLWWAGDRAVRYAVEFTDIFGITSFTVGFLIMSISTGLPEIVTAVIATMSDAAGLSAGDLIGSSLVNLSLVLGLSAIAAGTMSVDRQDERSLLKILAVITLLVSLIFVTSHLTVWHGALLVGTYIGSVWLLKRGGLMRKIVREETATATEDHAEETFLAGPYGTGLKFLGSLAFVVLGAELTVTSALSLAEVIGLSIEAMGATIVAVGTGLPEITLELNAVKRKEYALALGDIFGSTLVNLALVLGFLSLVSPTAIDTLPLVSTVLYLGVAILFIWKIAIVDREIDRWEGTVLIVLFLAYIVEEIGIFALLAS